ncbi:MAG: FG-GAP repeat domain-containing protein, partial [Anaerolineae bacterium]
MTSKFRFRLHLVDKELPSHYYAQTALVDLDNDGQLEYIVGQQYGDIFWYKAEDPKRWQRHLLGEDSPSDVGGIALDVDGDGWIDFVAGGAWYRNSRDLDKPWTRIVFDGALTGVHDVKVADVDGDGALEILTMSDQNSARWYEIPGDPAEPWTPHEIGPPVHAGLSTGDINGNGYLDVVRTDIWFENVNGDGLTWRQHPIGPNTPPPPDFQPPFAFDATYSVVCDMNGSGKNDIVFTDAEIPGGRIWWMENIDGTGQAWRRHDVYDWHPAK